MHEGPSRESVVTHRAVFTPREFLLDFAQEAARAKSHIVAQTMAIYDDAVGNEVLELFKRAPLHITKELYVDYWSLMTDVNGRVLAIDAVLPHRRRRTHAMRAKAASFFKRFEDAGVELHFLNKPTHPWQEVVPFIGRNHIKSAEIDDRVVYVGGFNFTEAGEHKVDLMVKFERTHAGKIRRALAALRAKRPAENIAILLEGDDTHFLTDAGVPGSSLILERACALVANAESDIILIGPLIPDGSMKVALLDAQKRGISVRILSSLVPLDTPYAMNTESVFWFMQMFSNLRNRWSRVPLHVEYNRLQRIHAKLLIVDAQTDSPHAYFGSHNLVESGVRAGTQEIGIETNDRALIKELASFVRALHQQ